MSSQEAKYALKKLKGRYVLLRLSEIIFCTVGVALITFALISIVGENVLAIISSVLAATATFVFLGIYKYQLHRLSDHFFTSYLSQQYPQLNASADLLLIEDGRLTSLQQLQKNKTLQQLDSVLPTVRLPHRMLQSTAVLAASVFIYLLTSSFVKSPLAVTKRTENNEIHPAEAAVFVKSIVVQISPPLYTMVKSFEANGLDLSVVEGSTVVWKSLFSGIPGAAKIFFSGRDSVQLQKSDDSNYTITRTITESGFYQLQWADRGKTYHSDFYKIEVVKDQAPKILVKNLDQFTKLKFSDRMDVQVKSDLSDDYGLTDAQIIATVSKGSGEGVKFREEKLRFASPTSITGKKIEATTILNLKKLGLDPGDELYFYVEAWDNKAPAVNHNRTETFFIAVQDTATEVASVDSGLGVDLMPEYFRSQRQIIIDTEKLLRDKPRLSKKEFNSISNELGFDQKTLRLRYGQFLGLEDEAGIGVPEGDEHDEEEDGKEKDVTKQLGHQHDTKNEHNLVDQKSQKHDHKAEGNDEEKEDPLKAFTHNHDDTEEATFFIQSIKTKLKAAVTEMWDAELYLRLYQPEKSLPYQYRALNLLKEISNDSRIYVHRSGFDPPPIKEERRLTADLSEVKTRSNINASKSENKYPAIHEALTLTEKLLAENAKTVSSQNQRTFAKAGQELAALAVEQPLIYLKGLSILKTLSDQSTVDSVALQVLRKTLWLALPDESLSPSRQQGARHSLNQKFLQSLEK
ncbi:hypothetical protein WSM22_15540 [Cytophagales bacterium WSM2-2]|nr:hypothetical protein WSM22_15540 [Cytophagales bacterium WSM2-2]